MLLSSGENAWEPLRHAEPPGEPKPRAQPRGNATACALGETKWSRARQWSEAERTNESARCAFKNESARCASDKESAACVYNVCAKDKDLARRFEGIRKGAARSFSTTQCKTGAPVIPVRTLTRPLPVCGSYHGSTTRPRTHESLLHAHHTSTVTEVSPDRRLPIFVRRRQNRDSSRGSHARE
jgi:hypothetical protein